MAHNCLDANGQPIPYTCKNKLFRTNITKGQNHAPYAPKVRGNVFREPIAVGGDNSLWFEHVVNNKDRDHVCYWLMWYNVFAPPTTSPRR